MQPRYRHQPRNTIVWAGAVLSQHSARPVCNLKFLSGRVKKGQEVGDVSFNDRFYLTHCIQNITISVCKQCPMLLRCFTFFFNPAVEIWNVFCSDSTSHPHAPRPRALEPCATAGATGL